MGLRRTAAALLAGAVLFGGCGGDDSVEPDTARLREADTALARDPHDRFALADVIKAAAAGAGHRVDTGTGDYRPSARPFLDRAASVWPQYLASTRGRPDAGIASIMVRVYDAGLDRPADAASAAELVAVDHPSAASYLQLAQLHARAGNRRQAKLAAQKALELAEPAERAQVRAAIRGFVGGSG